MDACPLGHLSVAQRNVASSGNALALYQCFKLLLSGSFMLFARWMQFPRGRDCGGLLVLHDHVSHSRRDGGHDDPTSYLSALLPAAK